ncbi:hypothetical protein [Streptomyces rubrogriseus]|uniref:hypothetical protein n=1 Tax=Streptomyces rubrogriseus TaxID=194673 RepID=UPI0036CA7832
MTAPLTTDAHEYGLVGDGTADDRPALQELVADEATWTGGRVSGNDFSGNGSASTRFDSAPTGGRWRDNAG